MEVTISIPVLFAIIIGTAVVSFFIFGILASSRIANDGIYENLYSEAMNENKNLKKINARLQNRAV
jgi:hypothetical protein